jgi:hypothetical protein
MSSYTTPVTCWASPVTEAGTAAPRPAVVDEARVQIETSETERGPEQSPICDPIGILAIRNVGAAPTEGTQITVRDRLSALVLPRSAPRPVPAKCT